LCFPSRLFTQSVTVAGVVSEKSSGEAVIGVNVMLYADTAALTAPPLRGSSTNRFGFYSIAGIDAGKYRLVVRGVGYKLIAQALDLSQSTGELRFDLQVEQRNVEMEEVVIQGETESLRPQLSTVAIKSDFARHMPSLGGEVDIMRVLQLLPGVKTASEISSGLYVRGGSPDQNLTLLDGVIVYNPYHLGGFLSTFNSDALLDTRLLKGAFPAEFGGRISSVLDLSMREGTRERLSGSAAVNLINSRLMVEGPIGDDVTFMVAARRMYLDLLVALARSKDMPEYYFYDLNAKVNARMNESDRLFLSGYFGRDVLAPPPNERGSFDISWGNATGNLRWMHILSTNIFTNFSLIHTNYVFSTATENSVETNTEFRAVSQIRDVTLRGDIQYAPDESHTIKAGVELTEHFFNVGANEGERRSFPAVNTQNIQSMEGAIYLQDEWTVSPAFSTNLGARLFYFENGNYLSLEPRLSASYSMTDNLKLKGSFAVANQFLHLIIRNDISLPTDIWFPSTESILPSRCLQSVVGIETRPFDEQYLLTVEAYYKDYKNLYEYRDRARFTFGAPLETQFVVGRGEAYGIEFFLNKQLGVFSGWVGYTLSWTKRHFPDLNRGLEFYPRYDRRHDIALAMMYRLSEGWEIGATWVYGSGQAYTMPTAQFYYEDIDGSATPTPTYSLDYSRRNAYRLPSFHKLDLNFIRKFTWFDLPWQLSINLYNVYNRRNPFAQTVKFKYDPIVDPATRQFIGLQAAPEVIQYTLFPFIPTVGLSVAF